jgi:hypothetical protein
VTQAELQQAVQRIATLFMDRIAQAGETLSADARRPAERQGALQRVLLYAASALEIASGPLPEVNAIDMLVFAILCRGALERHWIPNGLGEHGAGLVQAFTLAEQDLWGLAGEVLGAQQQSDLRELIANWQSEHPEQYRVEGVRFQEFAGHAGSASDERAKKTRGLLGQVRSATQAADQALLAVERGLFIAHRMPFLIRLQARLGVQETLSDTLATLGAAAAQTGPTVEQRVDRTVRRWALYLLMVGLGWALFFWSGYYVVKRLSAHGAPPTETQGARAAAGGSSAAAQSASSRSSGYARSTRAT